MRNFVRFVFCKFAKHLQSLQNLANANFRLFLAVDVFISYGSFAIITIFIINAEMFHNAKYLYTISHWLCFNANSPKLTYWYILHNFWGDRLSHHLNLAHIFHFLLNSKIFMKTSNTIVVDYINSWVENIRRSSRWVCFNLKFKEV